MEQVRTDKMKDMPVNKLMLAMGIPIVLSMILQAVYNIVDSAFVSNLVRTLWQMSAEWLVSRAESR